jgi:hypothetical protein
VTIRTTDAEIDAMRAACPRAKFIIGRRVTDLEFGRDYAKVIVMCIKLTQERRDRHVAHLVDHPVVAAARAMTLTEMEVNDLLWGIRISPEFARMREMSLEMAEKQISKNPDAHLDNTFTKDYIYQNFYDEDEADAADASVRDIRVERNMNELTIAFVTKILTDGPYDDSRTPSTIQLAALLAECGGDEAVAAKRLAIAHKLDRIAEYADQRITKSECILGYRSTRPRPAT